MSRSRRRQPAGPFDTTISALAHDGRGIGRVPADSGDAAAGKVVFIDGALPGETVRFLRTRNRSDMAEGRLDAILSAADERVTPPCPHFGVCGGCRLQHLDPAAQLAIKQDQVLHALRRIGHVTPDRVLDPVTGPSWGYRRRARLSVKDVPAKGRVLAGFRERDKPFVADIDTCAVLVPEIGEALPRLRAALGRLSIRDQVPQIECAVGDDDGALVVRVLAPPTAADRDILSELQSELGLQVYTQSGGPDTVTPLDGSPRDLHYALPDEDVRINFQPLDFIQINGPVNRKLVAAAMDALDPQPGQRIIELFAGLGNFSLPMARRGAQVHAAEGDADLMRRADANAQLNGLHERIRTETIDLFTDPSAWQWTNQRFDAALVDPPRAGARDALATLVATGVQRIVYVSCHPATLARDAGDLVSQHRFALSAVGVVDMFPQTAHVETLAVFDRR